MLSKGPHISVESATLVPRVLRIGAQVNDLAQRVEHRQMLLPVIVQALDQDRLFDADPAHRIQRGGLGLDMRVGGQFAAKVESLGVIPTASTPEELGTRIQTTTAAFKQVLVDSGMDKYIASIMHESNMSPLFMAWSIAAVLRIALGSATVAAITAGGIAAPLIATTGVSPELMVIAVGSGSVIFSHVNDPGFWLFKEYFNLTIGETIKSWSMLETIISVCGLVGCLLLGMVV